MASPLYQLASKMDWEKLKQRSKFCTIRTIVAQIIQSTDILPISKTYQTELECNNKAEKLIICIYPAYVNLLSQPNGPFQNCQFPQTYRRGKELKLIFLDSIHMNNKDDYIHHHETASIVTSIS